MTLSRELLLNSAVRIKARLATSGEDSKTRECALAQLKQFMIRTFDWVVMDNDPYLDNEHDAGTGICCGFYRDLFDQRRAILLVKPTEMIFEISFPKDTGIPVGIPTKVIWINLLADLGFPAISIYGPPTTTSQCLRLEDMPSEDVIEMINAVH